jgi:hypothetical protein
MDREGRGAGPDGHLESIGIAQGWQAKSYKYPTIGV